MATDNDVWRHASFSGRMEQPHVHRFSFLFTSLIILVSLLAHYVHGAVAETGATPDTGAVVTAVEHAHLEVKTFQIVDHGALDDIAPELCLTGEQITAPASTGPGHVAVFAMDTRDETAAPDLSIIPAWESPAYPPDVLRALLQVYLN